MQGNYPDLLEWLQHLTPTASGTGRAHRLHVRTDINMGAATSLWVVGVVSSQHTLFFSMFGIERPVVARVLAK